jgi:hypothetical protein
LRARGLGRDRAPSPYTSVARARGWAATGPPVRTPALRAPMNWAAKELSGRRTTLRAPMTWAATGSVVRLHYCADTVRVTLALRAFPLDPNRKRLASWPFCSAAPTPFSCKHCARLSPGLRPGHISFLNYIDSVRVSYVAPSSHRGRALTTTNVSFRVCREVIIAHSPSYSLEHL